MTRARATLLLPLLAIAACETQRKPLTGFDKPPPGGIVLDGGNTVLLWPLFDLPQEPQQIFRPRLNDQDAVIIISQEGFYDYAELYLQGWTGGWNQWIGGIPSGTYTVELVDSAGQSYGQSAPLVISSGGGFSTPSSAAPQIPAVIFTHFAGQVGSWTIDPRMQDADAATDEITVTNLVDDDVVVERCLIAAGNRTSCMPVGTIAPGADLFTVETVASSSMGDHQALFIHLASDANQSYQRDLVQGSGGIIGGSCQIERILVHGRRATPPENPSGFTPFAMSSCYGYASGGT
jgi:hypothetical protein